MELSQIRYCLVLARTLHFTKAAEACGISQPALTKAIRRLEDELGGPLFYRERGQTQLTELGRRLVPLLEQAQAAALAAKREAEAFRRRDVSPLRVGLEMTIPPSVLTPSLTGLRRHCEQLEVSLRQGTQGELCERMLAGDIDLGVFVDTPQMHERLHRWRLFVEHYILLCAPDHRFRDREFVSVPDFSDECLLLFENEGCPVRRFVELVCRKSAVVPRAQHFGESQEQLFEMVQASLGVSVAGGRSTVPASLIRRPLAAEPDSRAVVMAAVAGRALGPTPSLFLKLMRARVWDDDTPRPEAALAGAG